MILSVDFYSVVRMVRRTHALPCHFNALIDFSAGRWLRQTR